MLELNKLENPQVFVHDRYDLFSYLYKYYSSDVGRQNHKPQVDAKHFSPIYSLHRKSFHYAGSSTIVDPIYSNTGYLLQGNTDPSAQSFNSNANFQHNDHAVELRIPFSMLNIVNPIDMLVYGNFYDYGLDDKMNIASLGFSIYDKSSDASYEIENRYKQKNFRDIKYKTRLKASYKIVQDYLNTRN